MEQTRGFHPIHAAAVLTEEGTVLLAGPSGVGKSTLAVALALTPGARLLADSFVVQRGREVIGVREPVLIDAWSRQWLGTCPEGLREIEWRYGLGRVGVHVTPAHTAAHGQAGLLLFPYRARAPHVRPLEGAEAYQRLSAVDMIINDLRRYWAFAAVLEQLAPGGLMARREAQIAALTAAVPCYEIGLTPALTRAAATAAILDLLRGQSLRATGTRV